MKYYCIKGGTISEVVVILDNLSTYPNLYERKRVWFGSWN